MSNRGEPAGYLFWEGQAHLSTENQRHEIGCRVLLRSPDDLQFFCETASAETPVAGRDESGMLLDIPGLAEPAHVFVHEWTFNDRGEETLSLHLRRSPIWYDTREQLRFGRTVIINLSHFWIGSPSKLEFVLRSSGWVGQFIPVSDKTLAVPPAMHDESYRATYQLEFAREDDSLFAAADAQEYLANLSTFLSFCQGQWVATAFTSATDRLGILALEQWGTGRVSRWRDNPSGWLDEYHGESLIELCGPFCTKLEDPSWNRTLREVVYWQARADTNNVGTDGACILLQTTLERFAWHFLVIDRKILTKRQFEGLNAAAQIRRVLEALSIPLEVPPHLENLGSFAERKGLDGPEAFTAIRNRLVHPPRGETVSRLPYYEAYCLAKWYVELAVLAACGYEGQYSNRTQSIRWKGQVEAVPWAVI